MERVEVLNARLVDHFGVDTVTGQPMFRIVWSNDQLEKRKVEFTDEGLQLLHPEVREVKKYSYIKDRYVLERLVIVPEVNAEDLPTSKLSYEPLWVYQTSYGEALPPVWEPTKFVIDTVYAAMGKRGLRKYVDSEENTTPEGRTQRVDKIQEELFGDESGLMGKTFPSVGEGIVVPQNYAREKESE